MPVSQALPVIKLNEILNTSKAAIIPPTTAIIGYAAAHKAPNEAFNAPLITARPVPPANKVAKNVLIPLPNSLIDSAKVDLPCAAVVFCSAHALSFSAAIAAFCENVVA